MAPVKFEDTMRERLEQRKIAPSDAAWDRIAGKLETHEVVKKSNRTLWLAIAASFVGGVIATLLIINNPTTTTTATEIVTTNDTTAIEKEAVVDDTKAIELIANQDDSPNRAQGETQTEVLSKAVSSTKVRPIVAPDNAVTAKTVTVKVPETPNVVKAQKLQLEIKEAVTQQGIAQVDTPGLKDAIDQQLDQLSTQVDLQAVSDAEIDSLLQAAQLEIMSQQAFSTPASTVDAEALLLDVEAEVDPASFKDKIFEALSDGFKKARDAVADRNN